MRRADAPVARTGCGDFRGSATTKIGPVFCRSDYFSYLAGHLQRRRHGRTAHDKRKTANNYKNTNIL